MSSPVVPPTPDTAAGLGTANPPTILIVEDEAMIRDIMVHVLQRSGYRVLTATDGRKAVESLRIPGINLIITDLYMPQMDGMELVLEMRRQSLDIPVIAISGALSGKRGNLLRTAQLLGAKLTLAKPFSLPELIAAVRLFVGSPVSAIG